MRLWMSHSTRVRGLKLEGRSRAAVYSYVALYTSAWIEIWSHIRHIAVWQLVALYTSAWIEIDEKTELCNLYGCRTLHECVD